MRRLAALVAVLGALALSACGDDSESSGGADAAASAGAAPTGDAAITAKAFNKLAVEDELGLIERLAAANRDDCAGVKTRSEAFRQAVFINATQARPGTLIADLVAERCRAG